MNLAQLRAGVDVDQGPAQHADLADPIERPGRERRDRHRQVDGKEGEGRHEPQREQIKSAVLLNPTVNGRQLPGEPRAYGVAER